MKPSIGRIVIYCENGVESAAIVTSVVNPERQTVSLALFPPPFVTVQGNDASTAGHKAVYAEPLGADGISAYWKWPERV